MLDNRQLSGTIWLAILLTWGFSKAQVRKAAVGVLKAVLASKPVLIFSTMAAYIALTVYLLHAAGLWAATQLKDTVLWALTAALVMVVDINSVPNDRRYFQKALRDGFKVSVILEFIANLFVFSLPIELVLVPAATILGSMLVLAESKDEFKPVRLFLNTTLALLGLTILGYSGYRAYTDFHTVARTSTLADFLLPIILTAVFLPFLYLLATLVSYESLFVRLQFFIADADLRRFAKIQLVRHFGLDFRGLNQWSKRLAHDKPSTRDELLASIRSKG
jgi:hypothetical protein